METTTIKKISEMLSDGPREYTNFNPQKLYALLSEAEREEMETEMDKRAEAAIADMEDRYANADIPF
jgi:hypothetical protein